MVRIIISGSREFRDYDLLKKYMKSFIMMKGYDPKDIEIISGGSRGADAYGIRFANEYNLKLKIMNADWGTYGKKAGPIRNKEMLEYAITNVWEQVVLVAFWNGTSVGTKHMINICKDNNRVEVYIVNI